MSDVKRQQRSLGIYQIGTLDGSPGGGGRALKSPNMKTEHRGEFWKLVSGRTSPRGGGLVASDWGSVGGSRKPLLWA